MINKKNIPVKYSRTLNTECKKYKISVPEKAFADLLAIGWKDSDAYIVSGLYNPVYTPDVISDLCGQAFQTPEKIR